MVLVFVVKYESRSLNNPSIREKKHLKKDIKIFQF